MRVCKGLGRGELACPRLNLFPQALLDLPLASRRDRPRPPRAGANPVMTTRYDVLGIGNALVDVIAQAEEDVLITHGMHKGAMALMDEAGAERIYSAMGPATEVSGGSAANTTVGVASLGARAAFIGKVKADPLGEIFGHDIRASGVAFATPRAAVGPGTGRCLILVTPDGERTMNTYLGAAQRLMPADIDADAVAASAIVYLEGYLWDPDQAKAAFLKAAHIAHQAGRKVALTLSDAFCVDRWRDEFVALIRDRTVDLVFANEAEIKTLYQTAEFDAAVGCCAMTPRSRSLPAANTVASWCDVPASMRSRLSRLTASSTRPGPAICSQPGFWSACAVTLITSPRLGSVRWPAAEIIQHVGARPQCSLKALAEQHQLAL